MENVNTNDERLECIKGAKSVEEIADLFDGDETCIKCQQITYRDGVLTCKYSKAI